jgi:hypothetical protein
MISLGMRVGGRRARLSSLWRSWVFIVCIVGVMIIGVCGVLTIAVDLILRVLMSPLFSVFPRLRLSSLLATGSDGPERLEGLREVREV